MGRPPHVGFCFKTGRVDRPRLWGSRRARLVGSDLRARLPSSRMEMGAGRAQFDGDDCLDLLDRGRPADAIGPC